MSGWQELGEGVYRRRYESLDLNIGVVVGSGGVLVIDTRASHRQARELLRELRQLTDLPVRRVVNTHFHWDHCWGNALFPDAELWGHRRCREVLLESGEEARAALLEQVGPDQRGEFEEVVITPPEHVISSTRALDIGDRLVKLAYHGRGHTDSDITITVADADVTFAGDLVEQGAPPSFGDSFPLDWPKTLDRMLSDCASTIVPGHGDIVDAGFVAAQRDDIAAVNALAQTLLEDDRAPTAADLKNVPYPRPYVEMAVARARLQL